MIPILPTSGNVQEKNSVVIMRGFLVRAPVGEPIEYKTMANDIQRPFFVLNCQIGVVSLARYP
jgi:hypothetical protein